MRCHLKYSLSGIVLAVMISACATVPDYETPTVSVTSFSMLPTGSMTPRFRIGLNIVNPNRIPLELDGIAYTVYIEDHKILTGASNDLPVIEPYGEGEVAIYALTNMMGSIGLLSDLMRSPRSEYHYKIDARLAPAGRTSDIRIIDEGTVHLGR